MNVILLAGYDCSDQNQIPFALREIKGQRIIDWQIAQLLKYRAEITVVLGGPEADNILRESKNLHHCELIFDTHSQQEISPWTNLRAGLYGASGWTLALDIRRPTPSLIQLKNLRDSYFREGLRSSTHIYCMTTERGPWLISRSGRNFIKSSKDFRGLRDSKLHVKDLSKAIDPQLVGTCLEPSRPLHSAS